MHSLHYSWSPYLWTHPLAKSYLFNPQIDTHGTFTVTHRHGQSSGSFKSLMGHLFSAFIGDCVFKIVVVLMCYVIFLSTKSLWCALWRKSVLDKLYSDMRSSAVGYEFNIYELMYTLNKISLNRSIHKNTHKKGYVLISMLWPEVHRNITLYFL